uniref:Nucleotidyltransferase family protein n=1 Tax=Tetraselmis sp. GSL018 TaxID=582737 RepID=A0A061SDQ2_9CHLO
MPEVGDDYAEKAKAVEAMGELLQDAGMQDVMTLSHARVPVVKFVHPTTQTKCDITVNNILACINTKLLRDYAALDPRLRQLVFIIKHWAKRRKVNEAYTGTLSSYAYVLMCIHLLQQRDPPVLPCLQSVAPPTFKRTVGSCCCDYFDNVSALSGFGSGNTETVSELLMAFFDYWAWGHDYVNSVISIRTGGFLTKADKEWTKRVRNERHLVCIEDPFDVTHDLGRVVDRASSSVLREEFKRAAEILSQSPNPLPELFEPFKQGG